MQNDREEEWMKKSDRTAVDGLYMPLFFRPANAGERKKLEELHRSTPQLRTYDRLHAQLQELVRIATPWRSFTPTELNEAVDRHLNGIPPEEYGVWVYYPWSLRLVHLLDEKEFRQVRTDRNRNKITREEQDLLATKKVGVIGLSVGQSVSLTLALERCCGEIRLADHDTLDLSNLNRIRSGVHDLGVNKAVLAAREIAEIDPFLKVVCYTEGITAGNIDAFFTEGGTLDVLAEECDSVDMKILAREKARELAVPVVMDTSDRGMIDVERFDRERGRPIMHGALEGLELPSPGEKPTPDQRMAISLAFAGKDSLSDRMKASLPLIGKELSTWPQLASGVCLGGAAATDVIRRILLGDPVPSGRTHIDLEQLIVHHGNALPASAAPTTKTTNGKHYP